MTKESFIEILSPKT